MFNIFQEQNSSAFFPVKSSQVYDKMIAYLTIFYNETFSVFFNTSSWDELLQTIPHVND